MFNIDVFCDFKRYLTKQERQSIMRWRHVNDQFVSVGIEV